MGLWSDVDKLPKTKYPSFSTLWGAYPIKDNDPCDRQKVQWQCAVYLTAALAESGIIGEKGLDGSQGYGENPTCPGIDDFEGLELARGSQTLHDFLYHRLFPPRKLVNGKAGRKSATSIHGIIFYKHIKGFINQGGRLGSHIDLWNGPNIGIKKDPYKLGEYFDSAREIRIWKFD